MVPVSWVQLVVLDPNWLPADQGDESSSVSEVMGDPKSPWISKRSHGHPWRLDDDLGYHDFGNHKKSTHCKHQFILFQVGGFKHFLFFHNIWDNPSHWLIFFNMVKTTNQILVVYLVRRCLSRSCEQCSKAFLVDTGVLLANLLGTSIRSGNPGSSNDDGFQNCNPDIYIYISFTIW